MACDPQDLLNQSKCFEDCLLPGQQQAINIYLLTQIAGMSSTGTNTLLDNAKCFDCLTPLQLKAIEIYILCQIAGV